MFPFCISPATNAVGVAPRREVPEDERHSEQERLFCAGSSLVVGHGVSCNWDSSGDCGGLLGESWRRRSEARRSETRGGHTEVRLQWRIQGVGPELQNS